MKILHTADVHLDSRLEANLVGERAAQRRREIQRTFENMTEYAVQNQISAVLISGDLFDTSVKNRKTRNEILSLFEKHPQIDFFYLRGNHDGSDSDFNSRLPENVKTFGDTWTYYRIGEVTVAGCEDVNNPSLYSELELSLDTVNIVMLHGQIVGGKAGADCISIKNLKGKGIDYLALGHIHSYGVQNIDARGNAVYCGCPDGRGFDECGEKGFVIIDVDGKKVSHSFLPFASRHIYEKEVDISGVSSQRELEDTVLRSAEEFSNEDLVKIILVGTYMSDLHKDVDFLTSKLNERLFFAKIYDRTHIDVKVSQDETSQVSLAGEFLRLVSDARMSDEERELVIEYGIRAIKAEELD